MKKHIEILDELLWEIIGKYANENEIKVHVDSNYTNGTIKIKVNEE